MDASAPTARIFSKPNSQRKMEVISAIFAESGTVSNARNRIKATIVRIGNLKWTIRP